MSYILELYNEFHFGVNYTLSQLRQRVWVPKAKQVIKNLLHNCIKCKKLHSRPFSKPDVPPLPSFRVEDSRPFSAVCVDYTRALNVRNDQGDLNKYYVCLFTCATTRAVHLELVEDLSAEAFIRALIRFCSRRSFPRIIFSDNATNFKSSNEILSSFLESCSNHNYPVAHGIEWKFTTPSAPWTGGVHERLIGIFKQCLKKVIGTNILGYFELLTIVTQIECALNDRPLTGTSEDVNELQPLTPSMLLNGSRINTLPIYFDVEEFYDPSFNCKEMVSKRFNTVLNYYMIF